MGPTPHCFEYGAKDLYMRLDGSSEMAGAECILSWNCRLEFIVLWKEGFVDCYLTD
uniref:Uncharacterized protein n=1 Tax=Nelumbo nucifera TaxID=4432 RepID=A0A822Z3S5_NELNU|nr:TPA_asm: hypothetical protein HUJ06_008277 [Nelumbo nucifera]